MARLTFSTFNNNATMSSVRTTINNNFTSVAMAKPLDGTSFIDAGTTSVSLVAIASNGTTYTMASSRFIAANGSGVMSSLVLTDDLVVNGNSTLGDSTADLIRLNGTIVGTISGPSANANLNNIAATGSVTATSGYFTNLYVNGSTYTPWVAATSAPIDTTRLWINTAATVPYLQYYNGNTWVSLGAVFG